MMSHKSRMRGYRLWALGLAALIAIVAIGAALSPASARAGLLSEGELTSFGEAGSGAGQIGRLAASSGPNYLSEAAGIAADPVTGDVYLADSGNNRIDEFTAWGLFVRSWGWGVRDGSHELQSCGPAIPESNPDPSLCRAGIPGPGAGQMTEPTGIAVAPNGDIYVFEAGNHRLQAFDREGHFVRSIGGDVIARGPGNSTNDETQEITVAASSGTFKLSFAKPFGEGEEEAQTAALPYDATAEEIETALDALATIGGVGGSVKVSGGPGSSTGSSPYEVTFEGNLAGDDVPQLRIDRGALGPTTVGARLVCTNETVGESFTYEWLRDGTPISGATSQTYVTTAADEGKAVQCASSVHDSESGAAQAAIPAYVVPPVPTTPPPVAPVQIEPPETIDGSLSVGGSGGTLQCRTNGVSAWDDADSFSYSWYHNGERIEGATSETYVASSADLAAPATFQCAVTGTNVGGGVTKMSSPIATKPEPTDHEAQWRATTGLVNMEGVRTLAQGGGPEICNPAAGDVCKPGRRGGAGGEIAREANRSVQSIFNGDNLDIAPDGTIYVGDWGRIQELEPDGSYKLSVPLARSLWFPGYPMPQALSVAPEGDIFVAFRGASNNGGGLPETVYRLSPNGAEVYQLPVTVAESIAAGAGGIAYASDAPNTSEPPVADRRFRIREIDGAGDLTATCCVLTYGRFGGGSEKSYLPAMETNSVTTTGAEDLYVARYTQLLFSGKHSEASIQVLGPPPDKWPAPPAPPQIHAEYVSSVGEESAIVGAEINPVYWADTRYHLEWGTEDCELGACTALPTKSLGAGVVKRNVASAGIVLSGLTPGTTYHYRFVAESSGGGPTVGPDRTFTTFSPPGRAASECPNQEFRTGSSSALPDCRAYEMVSPVDKEGNDIETTVASSNELARLDQGSAAGGRATFSAAAAFGDAKSSPYSSQYLSTRGEAGWETEPIAPPRESGGIFTGNNYSDSPYKAFSEELDSGWVSTFDEPTLAPGAPRGYANIYRRDTLTRGYEPVNTVQPPGISPSNFSPTLVGFSADGSRSFFRAQGQLTPEASANKGIEQVYESHAGELHLVSIRPSGVAAPSSSTVGGPVAGGGIGAGRFQNVATAVSEDGQFVYWTEEGTGKLYLRLNGAETIAVSGSQPATFRLASPGGGYALYEEAGKLRRFNAETHASETLVESGLLGVMGASTDLSRVYFASSADLASGAEAGAPNLYLYENGAPVRFIAVLGKEEAPSGEREHPNPPVTLMPLWHFGVVAPDGQTAIFMSRKALTGADNIDRETGEEDAEVFRYDAEDGDLTCVSCSPTGARPLGTELSFGAELRTGYFYAARIPGAEFGFHMPRSLSTNGNRVFFDSADRLVPADTNGRQDVYEWEATGEGECTGSDARGFDPASAGCLYLISDGRGPTSAEFMDASRNGSNVFFLTGTSLLPQDPGEIDVYDARVDGGFPQPPTPAAECEGEACQGPITPPPSPPYSSQTYQGPGNVKQVKEKKKPKKKRHHKKRQKAKHYPKKHHKAKKTGGRR